MRHRHDQTGDAPSEEVLSKALSSKLPVQVQEDAAAEEGGADARQSGDAARGATGQTAYSRAEQAHDTRGCHYR